MTDYTRKLAEFVTKGKFEDFPAEVVEQAKLLMLDTLGCAIAGYTQASDEVEWLLNLAQKHCPGGNCSIICDGSKTSPAYAALVNGGMVHTIDYDDTHMGSIIKCGSSLLPVILAYGEQYRISGKELLTAFILGLEIGTRVGRAVMPSHYKYWHPTGTTGGISAGSAAAKLLKLNAKQTEYVIGHCADAASGMRYAIIHGDFSKTLHPALAAMKAVIMADLVELGAHGPEGMLEYEFGFVNAYSSEPNFEPLLDRLGEYYEIMEVSIKSFPSIQCSHTAISAALDLISTNDIKAEDIEKVDIIHTATVPGQGCNSAPDTPLAARLSIPYCMALCAYEGRVELDQFTEDRLENPDYRNLMERVTVTPDDNLQSKYPETIASYVDITCNDGAVYSGEQIYPKGDPRNRMSSEELKNKFWKNATISLSEDKAEALIKAIDTLEDADNIDHLISEFIT